MYVYLYKEQREGKEQTVNYSGNLTIDHSKSGFRHIGMRYSSVDAIMLRAKRIARNLSWRARLNKLVAS